MNTIKPKYLVGLMMVAAFTTACSEKMPQVNDQNCTQTSINQIEDSETRDKFSDECFDYRMEQGKEKASNLMEQGEDKAEEMYDNGVDAAEDMYDSAADTAEDMYDDTADAMEDGADAVEDEMDSATN